MDNLNKPKIFKVILGLGTQKKPFLHDTTAASQCAVVKSEFAGQRGGSFLLVSMSILHSM